MIALSTAYNINKHKSPESLVDEILSLGFAAIELNVEVPADFIPEIAKRIKVVSVHNFCPKLDTIPEGRTIYSPYSISSTSEHERIKAIRLTERTIDVADNVGAKAVIIHVGEVEMERTGRALAKKYIDTTRPEAGGGNESKAGYDYYLEKFLAERKQKSDIYIDNVLKTLDKLTTYAERKNIKIGVENRFWADEIPSFEDYDVIFKKFSGGPIGIWYDTGHAMVAEKQGLIKSHLDFLKKYYFNLIGVHLHDVVDVYDHKAPGTGEVDFSGISKYMSVETILVNETHSSATAEDLKNSTEYLKNNGFRKFIDSKIKRSQHRREKCLNYDETRL